MSLNDLHLSLINLQPEHYPQVQKLMDLVYADIGGAWPEKTISQMIKDFPEGQLGLMDDDKLVGIALSVRVDYLKFSNPHTYDDLIGPQSIILNNDKGDAVYGLDMLIHPKYRGFRLGRRLYDARKELCRQYNLKAILAGGRITEYHKHSDTVSPSEYINKVGRKEIYDPILSFQLSNDFQVKRLLKQYLPEDEKSAGYATLLEWNNILYEPDALVVDTRPTQVRLGVVQWQMREVKSVEELMQQVEFFVDALSEYESDFALFPEFFNAPLMGLSPDKSRTGSIRFLASFTEEFCTQMSGMAVSYNINIITGSMPLVEDERLYNVSYLCRRDGTVEEQRKLHITPHEKWDWVIEGGNQLKVFDTDAGKIGILICYDVEFPELGRLLAEQGLEILFVPFWVDTKNAYLRVRHCAQARAIENECYVAIAGSVGNLPSVDSLDVQYAQSAVFTPSDFSFPHDAVLSETTPNTEMLMFANVNLEALKILKAEGAVTNSKDKRRDLYQTVWLNQDKPQDKAD
ncbi:carbon-nitrogen hydrolase family protein [Catenovulum maritimum]|uniref:Hydrolase n=1 Tax=Catenovulum maritimum TaxID=1513271 RepID=A0A0J8GNZ6_9ALTE|nr:bifunctional GNAT family N-acetyltransferase/carbon-nitrogen hydrolase family protein [Catenovulum maritimum]KMT64525.1 hydrolase [Catenovulum maritimum]